MNSNRIIDFLLTFASSRADIGQRMVRLFFPRSSNYSSRVVSISASLLFLSTVAAAADSGAHAPTALRCESLVTPLGIDPPAPRFSWQLDDVRFGARQTAYEIEVFSGTPSAASPKANVWDSGRVESGQSVAVPYTGPALEPEHRYYWRVKVWDKDDKPYPVSRPSWWETGLMRDNWKADWIGFETGEHRRIRESGATWITNRGEDHYHQTGDTHHEFRLAFSLDKPVRTAHLYVTGKDTAAAWVNGAQVLTAEPLPPYKQTPWKRYAERELSASSLKRGRNLLGVEVTVYDTGDANSDVNNSRTAMSACLYLEMEDGSVRLLTSGEGWKSELNASGRWYAPDFDDSAWKPAVSAEPGGATGDSSGGRPWPNGPVKMLRRSFDVASPVRSARLYATALGAYRFWINGQSIGDQVLAPGWMDFRERVAYQVYDVTAQVRRGRNAIGAYLAPGWYTTPLQWTQEPYNYGNTPPALRAQLRIEHVDGRVEWVNTDASWKAAVSPIEKAEIYDGETYDARHEQAGWSTAEFSDTKWSAAQVIHPQEPAIVAQDFQPIRIERELTAKNITEPKPGVYVVDFGQNMAGVARLRARGKAGSEVRLRFAEVLNADGTIYTENLRTALATDRYTFFGHGVEEYQPSFTFHGFRYVEVSGLDAKPTQQTLVAEAFHTAAPLNVEMKTGSAMLNQLWSNILWGQRSNFVGVPTDCPQRDERLGWTGDAEVFWRAASYNMDLTQFSKKFAGDLRSTQVDTPMYGIIAPGTSTPNAGHGAGWSDAGIIVPWTSWLQSGDTRIIEQNWDAMSRYVGAIEEQNPDYLWRKDAGIPFGDWLSPEGKTKAVLIQTAYWAYDVTLMRQMAHAVGHTEDERKYAALFEKIRAAFAAKFVHAGGFIDGADDTPSQFGRIFNPKKAAGGDTQTGYVLALSMHLVPDDLRQAAADRLVKKLEENNWLLGTGFLGTPYLLAVLVDTSHADIAYRLLLNTQYPSWGYLVDHGATTMWERWNGDQMRGDPSMNSYNHYAYGAVADWIYRYAAGIDTRSPDTGFHTVYLHPNFNAQLGSMDFTYDSPYGAIHSAWTVNGSTAVWDVTIPANAQGSLPIADAAHWLLDGQPLAKSARLQAQSGADGGQVYMLPAGRYEFHVQQIGGPAAAQGR